MPRQATARQAMGDVRARNNLWGWGAAMRKKTVDDEERPRWFWKFVRGLLVGVLFSAAIAAALSIYVLPPPAPPPPSEVVEAPTGPVMIGGIEVSTEPAYTTAGASDGVAPQAETLAPVELSGPALSVNAAPYFAEEGIPLVAVVLDNTASTPLLHDVLFSMTMPLTIGVVAGGGGDLETATAARNAGFEVVAELPLVARGASGGAGLEYGMAELDASIRTLTLIQRLPMAIAATRTLDATAPPDTAVMNGMLGALTPLGFAYLDHSVGSEARPRMRSTELGATVVGLSRFTIPAGASAAEIVAVLDLASADAVTRGGAVVFAVPDEQVILALQLWGEQGSGALARLAPLSAVIRRQNGG